MSSSADVVVAASASVPVTEASVATVAAAVSALTLSSAVASAPVAAAASAHCHSLLSTSEDIAASPMLRILGLDSGAQFALLEFLDWPEACHLHCTGRSWRFWMDTGKFGNAVGLNLPPSRFPSLVSCTWVKRYIVQLELEPEWHDEDDIDEDPVVERTQLEYALSRLHLFTRLETLLIQTRVVTIDENIVRHAFAQLHKLADVMLTLVGAGCEPLCSVFLRALPELRALRGFDISGILNDAATLDFSALPLCPALATLGVSADEPNDEWRCSVQQAANLSRCSALTDLSLGSWAPVRNDWEADASDESTQMAQRIGVIVAAKACGTAPNDAASSAAASSCPSSSSLPTACFRRLPLNSTVLSSALWSHVSQLCTLEDLSPLQWKSDFSAADWAKLSSFRSLTSLCVHPDPDEQDPDTFHSTLQLESFLDPLVSLTSLRDLVLGGGLVVSKAHLERVLQSLLQLESFEIFWGFLEDAALAELARSPSLRTLSFVNCLSLSGAPLEFRRLLPPLPLLRTLTLEDPADARLTPEQAAPLNLILFAKMNALQPDEFTQNLLGEGDDEANEHDNADEYSGISHSSGGDDAVDNAADAASHDDAAAEAS